MKIPLHLPPCENCKNEVYVWIPVNDTSFNYICSCGEDRSGYLGVEITIGYKLLYRSLYELQKNEDYPLSIVFSASAFEWEVSRLYKKWFHINKLREGAEVTSQELNDLFLKHQKIITKVKKVGNLLYPKGFKEFVSDSDDLRKIIAEGFPSINIETVVKDFEKNLFWPRNRIVHSCYTNFEKNDAVKIYNIANLGLYILNRMDKQNRKYD